MDGFVPPHCPNPGCRYHEGASGWRWVRDGFYARQATPQRIQRYRCRHCRRRFSRQTFDVTYWLREPGLLAEVFRLLVSCSGYRQIARALETSPHTVATHAARLGRHCLLFHAQNRPGRLPGESLALDGFQSFEWSQYHPTVYHVLTGRESHFFHGFTESELRRSGRMTRRQKRRRAELEARLGRPDPRSVEKQVAALLGDLSPEARTLALHTDEHTDYPLALGRLKHLVVEHRQTSSRAARTSRNPLWSINLLDLLIRHSGANHKRETIAWSRRRQSAVYRLWVFAVWRNWLKWFSERARDGTPAMRLGLVGRRLRVRDVLRRRLFPTRTRLPACWQVHYWGRIPTRAIAHPVSHRLRYAM